MDARYEKFLSSGQPAIRLQLALEDGFREDLPESCRKEYEKYLHQRIVPAAQLLMEQQNLEKLDLLRDRNWLNPADADRLLEYAREHHCLAGFAWALKWKQETMGFPRRDFSL